MSQSSMEAEGGEEMKVDEVDEEMEVEQMVEEQIEEEEEIEEELYETIKYLLIAIQAIVHVLKEFIITFGQPIERPLNRRSITIEGYNYIHIVLKEDRPEDFRQRYRMYPDVFVKLCTIIREKTLLRDTKFICIEEMLATFLLIVGHNSRYCLLCDTFERSHWTVSRNFNKVLKALNTIAPEMMAKHGLAVPSKIRESTRFYPYLKDCIGAIDGTHIPVSVSGCDVSSYRNRKGVISQNVLAACNFDLEFMYILSGWEGSAHDSRVLNDALTRRNGLKSATRYQIIIYHFYYYLISY
ncbi:uncharacterized protein LOC103960769 isoform X1 [Pyrus x bretschneideri]|uniref:uncharacterized protein LOC103960769 isoform X1 n=1 Tax=Pyrus x bretschneideri TaxID=225117 RepID=UPI00202E6FC5|nr:uncharacterized protein LOC103960769 isoform X1 [Pyrus x bretschneideri]